MRILIVDDNATVRKMMVSLLARIADEIQECGDGADAVAAYSRNQPDWVLMDIRMGEVDGLIATRRIKAQFPEARIIIVTNLDDAELRDAARDAGACDYILKGNLFDLPMLLLQGSASTSALSKDCGGPANPQMDQAAARKHNGE